MNADSDNVGVNKNKSQANLMKGVSAGEVNAKINQIPSNICDYHISQKKTDHSKYIKLKSFDTQCFHKNMFVLI